MVMIVYRFVSQQQKRDMYPDLEKYYLALSVIQLLENNLHPTRPLTKETV